MPLVTSKEMFEKAFSYLSDYPVRDVDYIEKQCKKIADQLEELEKSQKNSRKTKSLLSQKHLLA